MKKTLFALALFAAIAASPAVAQQAARPADIFAAGVSQYYDTWTPQQWQALETQLLKSLRSPIAQVDPMVIMNMIYFETHFADAMELERGAARLLRVYERHPDEKVRLLALSGLHTLGDAHTMERLARVIKFESSPTLRHVGVAAVSAYSRRPSN
jgi:hypothetical protein